MMMERPTIVISPLIALMQDQVDALQKKGIAASFINSSLDRLERERRMKALARGEYDLLYVTPERFRKEEFLDAVGRADVTLLAVDEALEDAAQPLQLRGCDGVAYDAEAVLQQLCPEIAHGRPVL